MKRKTTKNDELSAYRANVGEDDGLDPREVFETNGRARASGRKARQLCAQVAEALQQAFGESIDDTIQSLDVIAVRPAPDATQLLILAAPAIGSQCTADEALEALTRAAGWLRSEVAQAITRKRAPQLVFRVLPAPGSEVLP